ncbi:hypothetical protein OY671_009599, partial [Metschnikowia pulcherrima]
VGQERLSRAPGAAWRYPPAPVRRGLHRLCGGRPRRPDEPDRAGLCRAGGGPQQLHHKPPGRDQGVHGGGRSQLRHQSDALPPLRPVRQRRQQSLCRHRGRLRRPLREHAVRRGPYPLSASPADPVRGRWSCGVAQRPQRHSQFAAHVQGTRPVEFPQPRHGAGRGGGGFRSAAHAARLRQREPPVVPEHPHPAGPAQRGLDS